MRIISVFIVSLSIAFTSFGQGEIKFLESSYDFGEVKQTEGRVAHEFQFTNVGDAPVKLTYVKASCGCTTPYWSKEEIAPGDTGVVKAEYNPLNRPGTFNKRLTINSNAKNARIYLYIKGQVEPKPKSVFDEYPVKIGGLRFVRKSINLGKITTEKTAGKHIKVYNDTQDTIRVNADSIIVPSHIRLEFDDLVVAPLSYQSIKVFYDPIAKDNLGYNSDNIRFYTDESGDQAMKDLNVMATIEEYFPPMTAEELAKAPKLSFDVKAHDFGKVKAGTPLETKFVITNSGLTKLEIRKFDPNCSCLNAKLKKMKIAPGKTAELVVSFDTSDRKGRQFKTITIFSNDPQNPTQSVAVRAEVTQ